jgi:CheY-like chemotaxis protein
VLVVDDDEAVRTITTALMRALGHDAVEADSGQDALALLNAGERFDLILTDIAMPQMAGTQFANEARQIAPDVPVMLMTGYVDGRHPDAAADEKLLKKPFRRSDLAEMLRATLRPR